MRGLIDHFITANNGRSTSNGRRYRRTFGRRMLRANVTICDLCQAADARDHRLTRIHAAYRRRNR
jgi:hypothetical protein